MASIPHSDPIADLLRHAKTIAVVGLSNSPLRPSHGVSAYMQTQGYRIIPVNPRIHGALGEKSYSSLLNVPEKIDIVNVFRRPEFVDEIVDEAIQLKVPAIWMQESVINERAAEKARKAGIFVVMDQCILKEHKARIVVGDQKWTQVAGVSKSQFPGGRIEHGINHGHELAAGKVLDHQIIQASKHFAGAATGLRERAKHSACCRH